MGAIMEWLAAVLAAAIVGIILLASVVGWGARVSCWQKRGLLMAAACVVIVMPGRLLTHEVGLGDAALLGGMETYLWARHGKHILKRADGLDGAVDGRIGLPRR